MSRATTLLTNAAYIDSELAAEFGFLPPSFLPFGNCRLLQKQIERLQPLSARLILTLPISFTIDTWDSAYLKDAGVEIFYIAEDMTLGESVSYVIAAADIDGPLRILLGDTYFPTSDLDHVDVLGISKTLEAYKWGVVDGGEQPFHSDRPSDFAVSPDILAGWFTFSSAWDFSRALTLARGDFLHALNIYNGFHVLRPVELADWIDFGHLQTYFRGRATMNTARSFNNIYVNGRSVTKTSTKAFKLNAEANWFESVPPAIRLYTPAFLNRVGGGYSIAYEPNPTLHEIYVFGRLEPSAWRKIAAACFAFLRACRNEAAAIDRGVLKTLTFDKTNERVEGWAKEAQLKLDTEWTTHGRRLPSLRRIIEATAMVGDSGVPLPGVMHGDLCFPNMFFDFRHQAIRVIDPRGSIDDAHPTVFGDLRYDLAKLNHSLEGYDLILSGRYDLASSATYDLSITLAHDGAAKFLPELMSQFALEGQHLSDDSVRALTVQLFLSMLPLHDDRPDRQRAFLANALRLASQMEIFK